ncbi:MAG: glycosyltransferase [Deltaproteobacteria bacterium]|nr:MAG: glycosyltransferase [Deltaproteobacteria bacterium]
MGRRLYRLLARGLERLLVPRCDGVVTTTQGWARIIAARYGKEAIVVRNAPEVTGRIVPVSWRQRLHLPPERKILLYAGGLQEGRGLFPIVEALPALPHCDLLLLGRSIDRMRERLEERSASLGVRGRVHFLPPVPAAGLLAHLGDADLGLSLIEATSLSHRYCLPNKVFEYLVAGIPVLVSDLPEMRDFVTTCRVGWVAPSLEATVLSATIEGIFANREAFRETVTRIARLHPSFTWQGEGAKLIAGYQAFTPTRKGRAP